MSIFRSPTVQLTGGIGTLILNPQAMLARNSRQNIILPSWSTNSNFTTSASITEIAPAFFASTTLGNASNAAF